MAHSISGSNCKLFCVTILTILFCCNYIQKENISRKGLAFLKIHAALLVVLLPTARAVAATTMSNA